MIFYILTGIISAIAIICILASRMPDEFKVTKAAVIDAPVDDVFKLINNAKAWQSWSPWAKLDTNAVYTYSGPEEGVGSVTRWVGNKNVGEGISTITESKPNEVIKLKLEFIKPMAAISYCEFNFGAQPGNKTLVTWSMYGENKFFSKLFGLVINCVEMVGKQYEQGLANINDHLKSR